MKNVYSTNPSYGLSTIKGFIYQSFNTSTGFYFKKAGNYYNMGIVSGEYHLRDTFIDNFLVFFKKDSIRLQRMSNQARKAVFKKKHQLFLTSL